MTLHTKLLYLMIALMLSFISFPAQANTLIVPEAFDVLSVNGVDHSTFSLTKEKRLALHTGRNVIVIEYDEIFDSQLNDSHESVRSQAYALIFEVTGENELILRSPGLSDLASAKQYAKNPIFVIVDAQRKNISLTTIPAKDLTFGTVVNADTTIIKDVTPQEASTLPKEVTPRMPFEKAPSTPTQVAQPDALNMLRYWWRHANEQEREAFLKTIEQHKQATTNQ